MSAEGEREGARELSLEIGPEAAGVRIDAYLAGVEELELSRSHVRKLIDEGRVAVNGKPVKASYKTQAGDRVDVNLPDPEPLKICPEEIPLDILYEDADLIVINKPRGMVVHPAVGNYSGTLVNALLDHCDDLGGINDTLRPGIVHRLDKDTTGALVVAKNDLAQRSLTEQIKARTARREYLALVHGSPGPDSAMIDAPIGRHPVDRKRMAVNTRTGKPAVTHFRVLERFGEYTLILCRLETGRTHQIRVHLSHIGHPVVGDPVYGPRKPHFDLAGQALHAQTLAFDHPRTGERLEFHAPPPEDMRRVIDLLRSRRSG